MVQAPPQRISLQDFLILPETKPASEYSDGQITQKPTPKGKHSKLQSKLVARLNLTLEDCGIAQGFTELRCSFAGRSVVPDIAVFRWDQLPIDESGDIADIFSIAPDWTIEILFPDQAPTKVIKNILHCLDNGSQMGWLIDPEDRSIVIYPAGKQAIFIDQPDQVLPIPEFANALQLSVAELFGWLQIRP
jgi:Uma2 family endonuclease